MALAAIKLYLPTMTSSICDGLFLMSVQMSTVKMVDDELKIDVSDDINAANITASIIPRSPRRANQRKRLNNKESVFSAPAWLIQISYKGPASV